MNTAASRSTTQIQRTSQSRTVTTTMLAPKRGATSEERQVDEAKEPPRFARGKFANILLGGGGVCQQMDKYQFPSIICI